MDGFLYILFFVISLFLVGVFQQLSLV
jgi:hypothetical protein